MSAGGHSNRFEHQVFLSFRRSETGTFVGHLFDALRKSGLRVFTNNDGVEHGEDIQQKLYEAIEHSEMSVVILSSRYADSHWYLDELVKIMDLEALGVHSVLPVFFKVEPTDVRKQKGVYANAFEKLEKLHEGKVAKWRSAMKRIADLRGPSLNSERDESKLVRDVIQIAWNIVNTSLLDVPSYIVGRDSILEEINVWLRDGSTDTEVGVIYGLGGIGKSTIAKIAYNRNTRTFDGCSFLANIKRKTAQPDGLACVLEQVISDVTGNQGNKIYNVDKGLSDVRAILCRRKVLLVLDDVDEVKNFPYAFVDPDFIGRGSKIIITTRNESLRKVSFFKRKFKVGALQFEESKKLLKLHARVDSDVLSQRQEELLCEFLQHCQGIPLALFIMGPLLRNKSEQVWENLLAQLKGYKDKRIFDVFRLSFECIDDKYTKELFLFIACFFVGVEKGYALKIWEACKLRPIFGLENLIYRCLVSIDNDGKLMMHQSIEDMGKEVSRQESIDELGKRSKLWNTEDSKSVLQDFQGTSIIRGLRLELPKPHRSSSMHQSFEIPVIGSAFKFLKPWKQEATLSSFRTSSFTMMLNLELLLLNHVQFSGSFENFPKKMKWLRWPSCPLQDIPSNFTLDELAVLDMRRSSLVRAWKGSKCMDGLRVLDLSYSDCLVCTPDLSRAVALECLFLEGCVSLAEVHESIGKLRNLVHLNLKGCESLVEVHSSVEALEKLTILNLEGCKSLTSFPFPSSLKQLNLAECTSYFMAEQSDLSPISPSKILSMAYPLPQDSVPSTSPYLLFTFYFPALKELNLAACGIARDDVLELLSCAPSLEDLNLRDNPLRSLSNKNQRPCLKLKLLGLRRCTKLQSVSDLPPSCEVNVEICDSLKRISFLHDPDSKQGRSQEFKVTRARKNFDELNYLRFRTPVECSFSR